MKQILTELDIRDWLTPVSASSQASAIQQLENGNILYMPKLSFSLLNEELPALSTRISNHKAKNISFNSQLDQLHGANHVDYDPIMIKNMMARFAKYAHALINHALPSYSKALQIGRTSYR